ncbi:adenylyl-sulfate kinase [Variovorax sp. J22R133]|uniref:adenylyl-sulfate kinase n=1 Tax=Variovorax brevis TaxID=3053503 RepID=UPI0025752762|nr:adenylyl-sulfate kinase [Variovorax sp. J22R133]MDM0112642.1 adenylyl-sulfate kinase [Variovorax sp. J22R133]
MLLHPSPVDASQPPAFARGQRPQALTLWLTGLPSAGKSTLAHELERELKLKGRACVVLDGDDLRAGLSRDLGFSRGERREHVRRVAEVARLFNEAGLTALVALIAPYRADRAAARQIIDPERYVEVFVRADLATCEARDVKGYYARARARQLDAFTGVDSIYEEPLDADMVIDTSGQDVRACVARLLEAF